MMKALFVSLLLLVIVCSCENRNINEGEKFRPRELHDSFNDSHFSKITVDGVEYLIMERDNNNPHEGFGFMAFRANKLIERQDTLLAYLKTMQYFQNKIYANIHGLSEASGQQEFNQKLFEFLTYEETTLEELEKETLINKK